MADGTPAGSDCGSRTSRVRMSKKRLLTELPPEGSSGRSSYFVRGSKPDLSAEWLEAEERDQLLEALQSSATGAALFEDSDRLMLVVPPFAIDEARGAENILAAPLVELLERPRA